MSADTNAGGWPDADKPGVPMEPHKDGMHALLLPGYRIPFAVRYRASDQEFRTMDTGRIVTDAVRASARYVGAIITPSDMAAAIRARGEAE